MGLLGLLRFSLMCLDFLAWPAFALGYPIWASIRAIETECKYHMKKLVTYWTIFSLISLLEHAFRLNLRVPYWPYVKLVAICWLVIPRFDGACHVYQSIVHPCSSVSLQTVINWFCCPDEKLSVNDTFLTSLETFGFVALEWLIAVEKLIDSKRTCDEHHVADSQNDMEKLELTEKNAVAEKPQLLQLNVADAGEDKERVETIEKNAAAEGQRRNCKEHHVADALYDMEKFKLTEKNVVAEEPQLLQLNVADTGEDKEREETIEKNAAAEGQRFQVRHPLSNLAKTQTTAAEVPAMSMPAFTEEKTTYVAAVKKTQREWTCAVCQVTTSSKVTLNSHLKGKKHKSNSEELKNRKQTVKNLQSQPARGSDSDHANKRPRNCVSGEKPKQIPTAKLEKAHNTATRGKHMQKKPNSVGVVIQHSKLLCGICNVRCSGEIDMAAHLKGRKHLDQIQSLCG